MRQLGQWQPFGGWLGGVRRAGGGGLHVINDWLFHDIFDDTTPEVGTWTITDTTGKYSVSGGELVVASGVNVNQTDPQRYSGPYTNAVGLALYMRAGIYDTSISNGSLGLSSVVNANPAIPLGWSGYYQNFYPYPRQMYNSGVVLGEISVTYVDQLRIETLLISRNPGAFYFQRWKPGAWTLVYVDDTESVASPYARICGSGRPFNVDEWGVTQDLPAAFADRFGIAYSRVASPGDDATSTMPANAVVTYNITAATGVTQELWVRRVDDNNGWIVRMNQSNGTIKLIEITGGVETERGSAAQTWVNSGTYQITVTCQHYNIRVYVYKTGGGGTGGYRLGYTSARNHYTATGLLVSHAGSELMAWPRQYNVVAGTPVYTRSILPLGDSKTHGEGDDTTPYPLHQNGYPYRLVASLATATGQDWHEFPRRIGRSSYGVNYGTTGSLSIKAVIDGDLAVRGDAPDYVLCNLGVNDSGNFVGNEAQWVTDYQYIIDTIHTRWPNARVGIARVWRDIAGSLWDSMDDTYIPQVISGRSWAYLGPDERIVLKGDDNGATNTVDGVHPSPAGHAATAAAWLAAMGY